MCPLHSRHSLSPAQQCHLTAALLRVWIDTDTLEFIGWLAISFPLAVAGDGELNSLNIKCVRWELEHPGVSFSWPQCPLPITKTNKQTKNHKPKKPWASSSLVSDVELIVFSNTDIKVAQRSAWGKAKGLGMPAAVGKKHRSPSWLAVNSSRCWGRNCYVLEGCHLWNSPGRTCF